MAEKKISKIISGGKVLIDLTQDTVVAEKFLAGYTAHGANGELITGTCTFDADTQDATVTASEILVGKTAYAKGNKVTGEMVNNGAVAGTISTVAGEYTIPQGYHDGSGKVAIDTNEQAKLIAENIREGITVLGVTGTMTGTEGANPEAKEVTPSTIEQVILPNTEGGFNYLSQVTVKAIPYVETENPAGGLTATIA